jgi:hypothetical protein
MPQASPKLITCIYCKEQRTPSREHVLARSLGGDATAPITCASCNGDVLSPLDQALAERSPIALSRIAATPEKAFDTQLGGEHFHYDSARDLHTEVKVANGLKPWPYPQIHFRGATRELMFIAADPDGASALVDFVDQQMSARTLREIFVKVGPVEKCTTSRLVMHRSKRAFVRILDERTVDNFFDALEQNWAVLREGIAGNQFRSESIPTPTIELMLQIRLDDVFRAVAKTAFNVLATEVGVTFALRSEFDPIRGRDLQHSAQLASDEIAVDSRFVKMLPWGAPAPVPTEEHMVTISYNAPHLLAFVTLYKEHSFLVEVGRISLSEPLLACREFSAIRRGNTSLDVAELYERVTKRWF